MSTRSILRFLLLALMVAVTATVVVSPAPVSSAAGFPPPARLLDTRPGASTVDGQYLGRGKASTGTILRVRVAGRGRGHQ